MDEKEIIKIYETEFKPKYEAGNYVEAQKIFSENPDMLEHLTNAQTKEMVKQTLIKNNTEIKEIKSDLTKLLKDMKEPK